MWLPDLCQKEEKESKDREEHPSLELEACKYIMRHIGGKFCELVQEEREAIAQAEETGLLILDSTKTILTFCFLHQSSTYVLAKHSSDLSVTNINIEHIILDHF